MPDEDEWLIQSERDLRCAKHLMRDDDPLYDLAAFFAQQAAETALKGFCASRGQPFPKIHDIAGLLRLAGSHDAAFADFFAMSDRVTRYAVAARYPEGAGFIPTKSEALSAIEYAGDILALVKSRIPPPQIVEEE